MVGQGILWVTSCELVLRVASWNLRGKSWCASRKTNSQLAIPTRNLRNQLANINSQLAEPTCNSQIIKYPPGSNLLLAWPPTILCEIPWDTSLIFYAHTLRQLVQNYTLCQSLRIAKYFIPSPSLQAMLGQLWVQFLQHNNFTSQHCVRGAGSAVAWIVSQQFCTGF